MQCLACDDPNPQNEEKNDPSRRFCNEQCQQSFYRIGLKDDGAKGGLSPIDDDDTIGLESSDGRFFRLKREDALKMRTIRDLVEDAGTDAYIPIPSVAGDVLDVIVKFVENEQTDLGKMERDFVFRLAVAINYLDVSYMMYATPIINTLVESVKVDLLFANFKSYLWPIVVYASPERRALIFKYDTNNLVATRKIPKNLVITAIMQDNAEWLQMLIWKGEDVAFDNNFPFRYAVKYGAIKAIRLLLNNSRIDPNAALMDANLEVLKLLLNHGIDPSVNDNELIRKAAERENLEIIRLLLNIPNRGIDPMAGMVAAVEALSLDSLQLIVNTLETRHIDIDYDRLIEIAEESDAPSAMIDFLTKRVDSTEPLKSAIMRGDFTQLRLLLHNVRDVNYDELIAYAEDYERDMIIEFLRHEKVVKKTKNAEEN